MVHGMSARWHNIIEHMLDQGTQQHHRRSIFERFLPLAKAA
jgi:hypothetical protein